MSLDHPVAIPTAAEVPSEALAGDGELLDLEKLLDRPYGRYRTAIFALCGLVMLIEGLDMYLVGNLVPALAQAFKVEPAVIAVVFTAQGLGLALGYSMISPMSDRVGRRPVILACVLGFSVLTLGASFAGTVTQFAVLRLLAFTFFGGVMPNIISLLTEMSSKRQRQKVVVLMSALYAVGAAVAGFVGPAIAEQHGWAGTMLAGGLVPLLILPPLYYLLPESPRFLVLIDPLDPRVRDVMRRITGVAFPPSAVFSVAEPVSGRKSLAALFDRERRVETLLIAAISAMSVLVINLVAAWLPTFLHLYAGFAMLEASRIFAASVIGAIALPLILSLVIGRVGAATAVAGCAMLAAAGLMLFAITPMTSGVAIIVSLTFGAFVVGSQGALNALVATAYPTEMRATGLGWTSGFGRLVAIAGPAIGGILLAFEFSQAAIALAFATPMLVVAIAALVLRQRVGRLSHAVSFGPGERGNARD